MAFSHNALYYITHKGTTNYEIVSNITQLCKFIKQYSSDRKHFIKQQIWGDQILNKSLNRMVLRHSPMVLTANIETIVPSPFFGNLNRRQ